MKNIAQTIHEILGNQEMSPIEVEAELNELVDELIQKKQETEEPAHWPGRYNPASNKSFYTCAPNGVAKSFVNYTSDQKNGPREAGVCCQSAQEAEFVFYQKKAELAVIKELARLNEGWRPDWKNDDPKWEPLYDHNSKEIIIQAGTVGSYLPEWFQAKSEKIWEQVIENLGEEKVKLALWPVYEEAK